MPTRGSQEEWPSFSAADTLEDSPEETGVGMGRNFSKKNIKLVWGLSAGRCAFPSCKEICIVPESEEDPVAIFGQIAHIVAHSDDGPRADPSFPEETRDEYDNLVLLCCNHHKIVDEQPSTYTVSDLKCWKAEHEEWIKQRLTSHIPEVGFAELEMVTQSMLTLPDATSDEISFQLTNPREKIEKNSLSGKSAFKIRLGLSKAKEVQSFVEQASGIDKTFPDRLKATFAHKYESLVNEGLEGDSLFEGLHEFACPSAKPFEYQAAGLAVITYLFEKCDIFRR